ncbi:MAG: hypothetical protein WB609_02230 [Candidatus Cybelea sp.]
MMHSLLLATTPTHVVVQNWPGPDKVAIETLRVATWTLVFAVLAFAASAIGNVIAVRDFSINLKQWKRVLEKESLQPDLFVTFDNGTSDFKQHYTEVLGGELSQFALYLRLYNSGTAPARNVALSVILPPEAKSFLEAPASQRQQASSLYAGPLRADAMHEQNVWGHAAQVRKADGSLEDQWRFELVRNGSYIEAGRLILYVPVAQTTVIRYLAVSDEGSFPRHGYLTLEIQLTADRVNTPA